MSSHKSSSPSPKHTDRTTLVELSPPHSHNMPKQLKIMSFATTPDSPKPRSPTHLMPPGQCNQTPNGTPPPQLKLPACLFEVTSHSSPQYDTDLDKVHIGVGTLNTDVQLPTKTNQTIRDPILPTIVSLIIDEIINSANNHNHFSPSNTSLPKELIIKIEKYIRDAFFIGTTDGEVEGYNTIRHVLGPTPYLTHIHEFSAAPDNNNTHEFIVLCNKHKMGVSIELTSNRINLVLPTLIDSALLALSALEERITLALNCSENGHSRFKEFHLDVSRVTNTTYDVGKYQGFHCIQERYKQMFSIANPWTYSFVDVDPCDAIAVSQSAVATPHSSLDT